MSYGWIIRIRTKYLNSEAYNSGEYLRAAFQDREEAEAAALEYHTNPGDDGVIVESVWTFDEDHWQANGLTPGLVLPIRQ